MEISLFDISQANINIVFAEFGSSESGLTENEVEKRLEKYGLNLIAKRKTKKIIIQLIEKFKDPLIILLTIISAVSFFIKDIASAIMVLIMVIISIFLTFVLENQSNKAAEKLQELVNTTTTVIRNGISQEIPLKFLVPGDIIKLRAGSIIPADIRLLLTKELLINQSALTGESMPVEKYSENSKADIKNPLELCNICYMGSYVNSGTATAIVLTTGINTYLGNLAGKISDKKQKTGFDIGIEKFTVLMVQFMLIISPLVFIINGMTKGSWLNAFLFALAVIIALTPEMLPMILTVNLSQGALSMSKKKVIVKNLTAIQNMGAMNILCSDKTGTLTQNRIILEKHLDIQEKENENVLIYAYINSFFQSGLINLLDKAILEHINSEQMLFVEKNYKKVDEIPFDFSRRRLSVIVKNEKKENLLVCKGAIEEVFKIVDRFQIAADFGSGNGNIQNLKECDAENFKKICRNLNEDGFRVLAVAYKELPEKKKYSASDESNLILVGFAAFLDPPKETTAQAIKELNQYGIEIKILTGDNEVITRKICKEVGIDITGTIQGSDIESMSETKLYEICCKTSIFAKLSPSQKERIVNVLKNNSQVVGYLGDGINDAPALKAADVGISVNTAVDIAKESADIILLEKNLLVLINGVLEGRKVFGNVMKYIRTRASLNLGNSISIVGASSFLSFLPLLPVQLVINNLLNDLSHITIPTDKVDNEFLLKPRQWQIENIRHFMLIMGPMNAVFDYLTFFIVLYVFHAWHKSSLFQTAWFIELLFTQILMIHIIRTKKIPFIQSHASYPLIISSILVFIFGLLLPYSLIGSKLGFSELPVLYWPILILILTGYIITIQFVKTWFSKNYSDE